MLYVFDMGNVIIDIDFQHVLAKWSALSGKPIETLSECFTSGDAFKQHECGKISDEEFHKFLCEDMQLSDSLSFNDFAEGWNAIFGGLRHDVIELMGKLRKQGHRVVVLSNTNRLHKKYWSNFYSQIADSVDFFYLSQDLGMRKPDANIFEYVLETERVSANDAIFFDDMIENVEGARKVGMTAVHVIDKNTVPAYFKNHDFSIAVI